MSGRDGEATVRDHFLARGIETTVCLGFGVLHPFLVDSLFAFDRAPRTAAALIGLGALAGGLGLVETIVVPPAAVTLAALCVTRLRTREERGPTVLCDER